MTGSPDVSSLVALFEPKSVVVIGASDNPNRTPGIPLRYLRERYSGHLHVLDPRRSHVQGRATCPSLADIPVRPDCALILRPAEAAVEAAAACAEAGVPAAVIVGAGFKEVGPRGAELESQLSALSRGSGMRILGPNTVGLMNPSIGFFATFSVVPEQSDIRPGRTSFITGSGGMAAAILPRAASEGILYRYVGHTGNECDVTLSEVLQFCVEDPTTAQIHVYVEGVRDVPALAHAFARAQELQKTIVVLKAGKSDVGRRAVMSHTGAIAGANDGFEALARRHGAIVVSTPDELIETGKLLNRGALLCGRRLAVLTGSGGAGVVQADHAERRGMELPPPSPVLREAVKRLMPPFGSAGNPFDTTPAIYAAPENTGSIIRLLASSGEYDAVTVMLSGKEEIAFQLVDSVADAAAAHPDIPITVNWESVPNSVIRRSIESGLPTYTSVTAGIEALSICVPSGLVVEPQKAGAESLGHGRVLEIGGDLQEWLADHDIAIATSHFVSDPIDIDVRSQGGPWVAKLEARPGFLHRSDHDGVRLGLTSVSQLRAAVAELLALGRALFPNPRVEVQEFVKGDIELLLSLRRDPEYGWLLTIGAGGYMAEILAETQTVLAPCTAREVRAAVGRLFGGRLVSHPRGVGEEGLESLADLATNLSRCVGTIAPDVGEVELNPVIVNRTATAVDWIATPSPVGQRSGMGEGNAP